MSIKLLTNAPSRSFKIQQRHVEEASKTMAFLSSLVCGCWETSLWWWFRARKSCTHSLVGKFGDVGPKYGKAYPMCVVAKEKYRFFTFFKKMKIVQSVLGKEPMWYQYYTTFLRVFFRHRHSILTSSLMPRSHQTFCPVLAVKLLGIMLRNRCWPIAFHTITAEYADGWC